MTVNMLKDRIRNERAFVRNKKLGLAPTEDHKRANYSVALMGKTGNNDCTS